LLLLPLILTWVGARAMPVAAASDKPADWAIDNGRFFTQGASESGGSGEKGFAIVDDDQARMWSEYRRLGGASTLGYPDSTRFTLDGFVVQATQRALLQWRPDLGRVELVNALDRLHDLGKDQWLRDQALTPAQATFDDEAGLAFDDVQA